MTSDVTDHTVDVQLQPHSPLKEAWHQSQYQKQEQSQCSTTALWASANPVSRMMPTPGGQVLSEADVPPRPRKLKRSLYHSAFYSASKKPFNNAVRHFGVPSEDAYEASFLPDPQPKEENIFERLQNTPTMHTTNYYTQVEICPWRLSSAPCSWNCHGIQCHKDRPYSVNRLHSYLRSLICLESAACRY